MIIYHLLGSNVNPRVFGSDFENNYQGNKVLIDMINNMANLKSVLF